MLSYVTHSHPEDISCELTVIRYNTSYIRQTVLELAEPRPDATTNISWISAEM